MLQFYLESGIQPGVVRKLPRNAPYLIPLLLNQLVPFKRKMKWNWCLWCFFQYVYVQLWDDNTGWTMRLFQRNLLKQVEHISSLQGCWYWNIINYIFQTAWQFDWCSIHILYILYGRFRMEVCFPHGESVGSFSFDFQMFRCLQLYSGDGVCGGSSSNQKSQWHFIQFSWTDIVAMVGINRDFI